MISRASDYLFVSGDNIDDEHPHGDLDRIIINGEVMPLRTGNTDNVDSDGNPIPKQNILRGEDISFLLEAMCERKAARRQESPRKSLNFNRKVDSGPINNIQTGILDLATSDTYGTGWMRHGHQSFASVFNVNASDTPLNLYPSYFIDSTDVHSPDGVITGFHLQKQRILNCFDDIEKFSELTIPVGIETQITSSDYVVDGKLEEDLRRNIYGICGLYQYMSMSTDYKNIHAACSFKVNYSKSLLIRSNAFLYAKNVALYGLFRLTDFNNIDHMTKYYYGFMPIATVQEIQSDTISIAASTINAAMPRMLQHAQNDKGDEPSSVSWLNWFQMNDPGTPKYEDIGGLWIRWIVLGLENMFALVELNDRTRLPD